MDTHRKCKVCCTAWVLASAGPMCPDCRKVCEQIAAVDRGAGGLTPPWIEARILLYAERAAAGLPIFAEGRR